MADDSDTYLADIAAGDPEAFGAWVAVSESRIRLSLMRFAHQVDVECVTQECLLRVWQFAPKLEPDGAENALLRWAIRVARNLAIGELRKQASRPQGHIDLDASPDDESDGAPCPPDPLLRRVIVECREKLGRKPGKVLTARLETSGLVSDAELAANLGMKTNTFLQNFGRARKGLRDCLERQGVEWVIQ